MDWNRYRELCDRGDVLSRLLLLRTARILDKAADRGAAARLHAVAAGVPIAKPEDHLGGADSDFFIADLGREEVLRILLVVSAAADDPALRPDDGKGFRGLREAWREYLAWLDGTHPRSPHRDDA